MSPAARSPLAVTAGEPAGIGPDLCCLLAQRPRAHDWVVVADPELLRQRAHSLGLPLSCAPWSGGEICREAGELSVVPVRLPSATTPGQLNPDHAAYVLDTLRTAAEGCQQGRFAAMVTAPVHKGIINQAGIPFSGHTEYLAECVGGTPVMMLATEGLRVALATTHLPLREVADAIRPASLRQVIEILHRDLRQRFGLSRPRILVTGLNPHAGEGGHLGQEEQEIIIPTLERLRQAGLDLVGPLPADTLFTPKYLEQADAVLAMYHDQGLTVLKYKGFGRAVNITLGLPIIRTSVDHGTALELAGSGQASPTSLEIAIATAARMAAPSELQDA